MSGLGAFRDSLRGDAPPRGSAPELVALWHDGRGDWDAAHRAVQSLEGADAAWVHAYLHRREGDLPNADHWYRRAGRERCETGLDEEWTAIAGALLANAPG